MYIYVGSFHSAWHTRLVNSLRVRGRNTKYTHGHRDTVTGLDRRGETRRPFGFTRILGKREREREKRSVGLRSDSPRESMASRRSLALFPSIGLLAQSREHPAPAANDQNRGRRARRDATRRGGGDRGWWRGGARGRRHWAGVTERERSGGSERERERRTGIHGAWRKGGRGTIVSCIA